MMTNSAAPVKRRTILKAGVAGLGLAPALALRPRGALAATANTPVIIVNPTGDFTLVMEQMLRSGGYFEDFGLDAKFVGVSNGAQINAALISGSADICGGGGFPSIFPAIGKGAKLKIVGGLTMSPVTALYSGKPEIKSSKDLIGRTVGTGAVGSLLYELVVALLQKQGVDYKQVSFVNIGSAPQIFRAVAAGTVDAGIAEIDYISQQQKYGVHVLSDGDLWRQLSDFTNQAFFTTDQMIKEKRDILVRTLAAHAKLFRYIASPASKQAFFAARKIALGVDSPEDSITEWKFYQNPGLLGVNLVVSEERMNIAQKLNVELGVQKAVLPYHQVADMSLARDALKLL